MTKEIIGGKEVECKGGRQVVAIYIELPDETVYNFDKESAEQTEGNATVHDWMESVVAAALTERSIDFSRVSQYKIRDITRR